MNIREAHISDAKAMLTMFHKLDSETNFMLLEPGERNTSLEEQKNIIKSFSESADRFMFIAEQEDISGFCVLIGNPHTRSKHVASLVVGVCKIHWGQGIGSALLNKALSQAAKAGIRRIELTVREDNRSAIALYKKFGFENEGIRKQSLLIAEKPANELYMAKLL